jgi:hypothetical protein
MGFVQWKELEGSPYKVLYNKVWLDVPKNFRLSISEYHLGGFLKI